MVVSSAADAVTFKRSGQTLALDWRRGALRGDGAYSRSAMTSVSLDKSVTRARERGVRLDVGECLRQFSQPEILSANDTWYCRFGCVRAWHKCNSCVSCSSCKDHVRASKQLNLWQMPSVLIVHLKRFRAGRLTDKLDAFVDCPVDRFDLTPFLLNRDCPPAVYRLYAVVVRFLVQFLFCFTFA